MLLNKSRIITTALILFVLLLPASAPADILFTESFSDPAAYHDAENISILPGSLNAKFHRETGDRIRIQDRTHGVTYKLDKAIPSDPQPDDLYISFCYRVLSDSTKDKFSGLVLYNNGSEVFGLGNDYVSQNYSFWTSDGQGIPIGEIPIPVDKQVHQIVLRITANPDGPERIKVGLDPFCRRSESRQPSHIWTEYETELAFDELRLRSGNENSVCEFDEIRIGTDWTSVTLADNNPGEYISKLTQQMAAPQTANRIGTSVARFWPDKPVGYYSFALNKKRPPQGPVPSGWKLEPNFGTLDDKQYVYVSIPAEVDLYGTGEVTGSLMRNGKKITLFNKDNYGYGEPDQLYQSHPWVFGVRPDGSAFGIVFDCTWKSQLDLRAGILFTTTAVAPDFPVIVIEADSPQQLMHKLADLTGTMPMPPRWALGYQQCRYSYFPDARVREVADTFRAKQIPCDVIWFDIDYMDGFRVFTFDPNHFPDPAATNEYIHNQGFKSVWMIDPGVKHDPGYSIYDSGTEADVWVKTAVGDTYIGPVWPGDCVFPDFTSPAVRDWWADLYKPFLAHGIDGVWNDMNEPAVFNDKTNGTMPLDNQHRGGGELAPGLHIRYHNVYGMLMVKASRRGIKDARPDKRPFVLSRANFLGGHRYAATWTGDNNATRKHMELSIPMSLNLSLSGQPFNGPDIGGFVGDATPELWAHWISAGAFYPFSRAHSAKDTADQEPWSFGPETEKAARTALQRRYRLMPYIYTAFRKAHKTGSPVMQPLFFADPSDLSLRNQDHAFLIGPDLMVVPKWSAPGPMPKVAWQTISLVGEDSSTDPYQCDLKVRPGSIIPLGPVVQTTEQINRSLPLSLIVVLDQQGKASGMLYEDAGDGYGYQKGQFCLSIFAAHRQGSEVIVQCTDQQGDWAAQKRLVSVKVVDANGTHHGFGDIVSGVKVSPDIAP
ncbi:Alpha-xylosidase [Anaerohalosphaera lusitana]|uniref:Alpha-xylosidase n=1 Tax=Anaerohalosphaera lusitana TaxID=1936003 RepID=A0A1U9NMS9_9BACT|nr:TIM-barrel domain-containing protein [Anaerohalosphaera lusitana]AQT69209.1 Alpha-xylosidase [Anaerohalosphaera lusitana]